MKVYCGYIGEEHLEKNVILNGWVKKVRKMGNLVFVDLKDRFGIVQIFATKSDGVFNELTQLSREDVINVEGLVLLRKNPNNDLKTGRFEIHVKKILIYSKAKTPPLIIEDETDANEEIRFRYRYLDLRRDVNLKIFELRSKVYQAFRNYLYSQDFIETETPILAKPTPEGARDFYVPTRTRKFYALPQSPQTFKQLLMVAGFQKYFQITKCFRDEDLRSDRQPEFTQVDIELSFADEIEIQTLIENLLKYVFKQTINVDLTTPFMRMSYEQAINDYGSDKPDLRFDLKIKTLNTYFENSKTLFFKKALLNNQSIRAILVPNINLNKKQVQTLEKFAKDKGAKGLSWISIKDEKIIDGSLLSIQEDHIIYKTIFKDFNLSTGSILLVADTFDIASQALGLVRINLASILNLKKPNIFKFVWIIDWPLYEYDNEAQRFVAAHHPFTMPTLETLNTFDVNKKDARGRSYDIVLNGYELGGGSVRIIDQQIQRRMFKSINMSDEEANLKFGFLLTAFEYGVPPHCGIALGLDRLMMILVNSEYIRDVVAFPKNNNGVDMMLDAPSNMNDEDLKELGLKIKND